MLVDMVCPNCRLKLQFDDSRDVGFCPYCGSRITHNISHMQNNHNLPNVYISFNSINPAVRMVTRIVSTGVKNTYVNGQTLSFYLPQGPQTIILKIGKKNHSRNIVVPSDNTPVRIYASFNGSAQIIVDQPHVIESVSAHQRYENDFSGNAEPFNPFANNANVVNRTNTANASSKPNSGKTNILFALIPLGVLATIVMMFAPTILKSFDKQDVVADSHKLYLDIASENNLLFSTYDIAVYLDGMNIGSIADGKGFEYTAELQEGEHVLEFCKDGNKNLKETKSLIISDDMKYSCDLSHNRNSIDIKNENVEIIGNTSLDNESGERNKTSESSEDANGVVMPVVNTESNAIVVSTSTPIPTVPPTATPVPTVTVTPTPMSSPTPTSTPVPTVAPKNKISRISLDIDGDLDLHMGERAFIGTVIVNKTDPDTYTDNNLVFISDNPKVATIMKSYQKTNTEHQFEVTPVSVGETYIYAKTADGYISSNRIKVVVNEPIEAESISLNEEETTLYVGDSLNLYAYISPTTSANKKVTWSSSDTSVVTVSRGGVVKAVSCGDAEITATTSNEISAICYVSVIMDDTEQESNDDYIAQREMKLKYTRSGNKGANIGKEWSFAAYIDDDGARNGNTYVFNADETIVFYCWAYEDDNYPDEGDNTEYYTVTEDDLINGFTVEVEVYVTENRGRNANQSAYFVYTFEFSPVK